MSRFINIESIIEQTSYEVEGAISKDRPSYPEALRTFEERRIDWQDKGLMKAMIIQPTFEASGVNSELWNFRLVSWAWVNKKRVSYFKELISKRDFKIIENNIQGLLNQGKHILKGVTINDLE